MLRSKYCCSDRTALTSNFPGTPAILSLLQVLSITTFEIKITKSRFVIKR